MGSDERLDSLARRQNGLVTRRQLYALGLTRRRVEARITEGRIVAVRRGVYRLCGVRESWETMAMAAVLAAGDEAILSHSSAARLWRLGDVPPVIELTVPRSCRLDGVVCHRSRLARGESTVHHGVPLTTAARTIFDLAATEDARTLGALCDEALRWRLVTVGQLYATVERHPGPGRRRLRALQVVLADRVPGYDPGANDWEKRMDRMWDQLGLPPARRQYRIRVGRRQYIVDRAIVDLQIAVEWNGYTPHGLRTTFDGDSRRRAELAAAGWYPLDFTSNSDLELICRTVEAVVAERQAARRAG